MVLNHCSWEIKSIKEKKAIIKLTYEKSERPALLKMFKEKGKWKVGLVETFWPRKWLKNYFK